MSRPCLDAGRNDQIGNRRGLTLVSKTSVTILLCFAYTTTVLPLELDENELFKPFNLDDYGEEDMEFFDKELNDCREQTDATKEEAEKFLRKEPQTTHQGKCYVACILTKGGIMRNDSIDVDNYMRMYKQVYGEDNEITKKLMNAMDECLEADVYSVEVCERASFFTDCINLKSKSILREAALGPTEDVPFDDRVEL